MTPRPIRQLLLPPLLCLATSANAETFRTNSFADQPDLTIDGVCDTGTPLPSGSPTCTLRAAVMEANADPNTHDEILLAQGNYLLTINGPNEDNAETGDLDLKGNILIRGPQGGTFGTRVIAQFPNPDRVFDIKDDDPFTRHEYTLRNLSIIDGEETEGGGVRLLNQDSDLVLDRVFLRSNRAEQGGAVSIANGRLFASRVIFFDNDAVQTAEGGGLRVFNGEAELEEVIFFDNDADEGGAIYTNRSGLDINKAAILSNNADEFGGGLFARASSPHTINIRNTTFSDNRAEFSGGGLLLWTAEAVLNNVTVTQNRIQGTIGIGLQAGGGGIATFELDPDYTPATVHISNSVIAGNEHAQATAHDCKSAFGTLNSMGYNIFGIENDCDIELTDTDLSGDIFSPLDPGLDVLSQNRSLIGTHALLPTSPALNTGDNATCERDDARSAPRPRGQPAVCDRGAHEN